MIQSNARPAHGPVAKGPVPEKSSTARAQPGCAQCANRHASGRSTKQGFPPSLSTTYLCSSHSFVVLHSHSPHRHAKTACCCPCGNSKFAAQTCQKDRDNPAYVTLSATQFGETC